MVWVRLSMSAGRPRPDSCQVFFAECFGQAFFQLPDPAVEPLGAFAGGEQVGLQGGAGHGRAGGVPGGRRGGFEGVDLLEQVTVPVEEAAVDSGGAGDAGGADLGAVGGGAAQDGDDPLPAAG